MARKKGINPVVAGTAGAVIGAGVALGATAALRSKKNRGRIKEVLEVVRDRAIDSLPSVTPAVRLNLAQVKQGMKRGKVGKGVRKIKVMRAKEKTQQPMKKTGRKKINSP